MDQIGALPIFVAVVKQQGFAPAARHLGISKSAVSKRISNLENHLGARLLHRSTRKISLTEAGERYYARAVEALGMALEAEDAVSALKGKPKGRLKINMPMSFGRLHIMPLIPRFLSLYPEIEIDALMDDRSVDLVDGGFDIGIRGGSLPDSSMIARKIAPCHNVLAASPEYLKIRGVPEKPHDLLKHNCLHYAYYSDQHVWDFQGPEGALKIGASGNFQVNNVEALMTAVLGGCGIARLTTFIASDHLLSGELVRLLPDFRFPEQNMYAIFAERKYMPSKVRVFIDFILDEIGRDQPYWDKGIISA